MPFPVAKLTDMHTCPMITPAVPPIPHVGGPIVGPGMPTVLVGGTPVSVVGDMCTCVGPPDAIIPPGAPKVLVGGRPVAKLMSTTAHGGMIVGPGVPTIIIGD